MTEATNEAQLKPIDSADFSALVDAAELEQLFLEECKAGYVRGATLPEDGAHSAVGITTTGALAEDGNQLACSVRYSFEGTAADGEPFYRASANYLVLYCLKPSQSPGKAAIRYFADNNAVFNTWPFFRQHLADLLAKMELPSYLLPLLKPNRS